MRSISWYVFHVVWCDKLCVEVDQVWSLLPAFHLLQIETYLKCRQFGSKVKRDRVLDQSKLRLISKWCGKALIHWNDCISPYQENWHTIFWDHTPVNSLKTSIKNLCNRLCKRITICLKNSNFTNQKWWVLLLEAFLTSFSFHLIWLQGYKVISMCPCNRHTAAILCFSSISWCLNNA